MTITVGADVSGESFRNDWPLVGEFFFAAVLDVFLAASVLDEVFPLASLLFFWSVRCF